MKRVVTLACQEIGTLAAELAAAAPTPAGARSTG